MARTENGEQRTENRKRGTFSRVRLWLHLSVLCSLFSVLYSPSHAQEKNDFAWIDRRIEAWQPTKDERRFDDIAWAADLRTAMKLAKQHDRPVFLFTHDGHMAIGRC